MTNRHSKPEDLFRAEKERALTVRNSQHARLLAEAKAAFDKLMAEGQAARKSGRPRKHPLPPLKTSSSRTPAPPPKPASVAPSSVAAPVSQTITVTTVKQPTAAAKPAKRAKPAKPAKSAGALAKPVKVVRAKKVVKAAAKSKPKAKRSSRR